MLAVEAKNIFKSFGLVKAVQDVSLTVEQGEFFGLLGPNGAGKTTSIRIMLDIFKPDLGSVSILGGPMTEDKKNRIGYMPEERGLYQDVSLERCLIYLGSLKNMDKQTIRDRLNFYLDKFDLTSYKRKKVKELSKGMQQKAQIIATLLHEPELLIIDEPFSGLDPVNTQMVKGLLRDLHSQGTTVIMCSHQMHQVEELCDRIMLINQGKPMLYGKLSEIRRSFSSHAVIVRSPVELPILPGVISTIARNNAYRLELSEDTSPQAVLQALVTLQIPVEQFEIAVPDLDEIFIKVVNEKDQQPA